MAPWTFGAPYREKDRETEGKERRRTEENNIRERLRGEEQKEWRTIIKSYSVPTVPGTAPQIG
jgi:hypothetical protein